MNRANSALRGILKKPNIISSADSLPGIKSANKKTNKRDRKQIHKKMSNDLSQPQNTTLTQYIVKPRLAKLLKFNKGRKDIIIERFSDYWLNKGIVNQTSDDLFFKIDDCKKLYNILKVDQIMPEHIMDLLIKKHLVSEI